MMPLPLATLDVPGDSIPFYVSDSYTLGDISGRTYVYNPGVFNCDLKVPGCARVEVYIFSCSFNLTPYNLPASQGINIDGQLALYDVGTLGKCTFKDVLAARSPYSDGAGPQIINQCVRGDIGGKPVSRYFGPVVPLKLGYDIPASWGPGPFQIGGHFVFNLGPYNGICAAYDWHMHGAWRIKNA